MMDMNVKMNKMMDIVEEKMPEDGRVCIHMLLNDGHHDEYTAHCKIRKMVPVTYLGITPEPHYMMEMVEALGLTPMKAREMVYAAYEEAKPLASSKGFQAPRLEANEWDCLWCIAMMVADYWVTHNGDLKVAAMLAYQYLSDPDKTVEY